MALPQTLQGRPVPRRTVEMPEAQRSRPSTRRSRTLCLSASSAASWLTKSNSGKRRAVEWEFLEVASKPLKSDEIKALKEAFEQVGEVKTALGSARAKQARRLAMLLDYRVIPSG